MTKPTIPLQSYVDTSKAFHWASQRHYQLWFTGQTTKRHRRSESVLKRLSRNGKLTSVLYQGRMIYTNKRPLTEVVHGLACTECLVRFYLSDSSGMVFPERYFKGFGAVPEWGILYPSGKMILLEYCTKSNYLFTGNMRGKLMAYRKNLERIEEKFLGKAKVLFVIDVPRVTVERFISETRDVGSVAVGLPPALSDGDTFPEPFYFCDYETFLSIPLGKQLSAPIYFGMDGKEHSCLTLI